jgi:hypothetical protein
MIFSIHFICPSGSNTAFTSILVRDKLGTVKYADRAQFDGDGDQHSVRRIRRKYVRKGILGEDVKYRPQPISYPDRTGSLRAAVYVCHSS